MPVPEIRVNVAEFAMVPALGREVPVVSLDYYKARNEFILAKLDTLPWGQDLTRIDPTQLLCRDDMCFAIQDGRSMYFDDHHLSLEGARKVVDALLSTIPGDPAAG